MRPRFLAVLLALAGCLPGGSTPMTVARVSGRSGARVLQSCRVMFRWSVEDLRRECGEPDEWVTWVGERDGKCAIYRDDGRAFMAWSSAPAGAVCFGHSRGTIQVIAVLGLDATVLGGPPETR